MTRYRREFWLDANKDDQLLLLETIDELKRRRSFTACLRDGIRLIVDLRAGRLDVLFELFPWTREKPQRETTSKVDDLERTIDQLRTLLVGQATIPPAPAALKPVDGPKALNMPVVALPRFDDDDEEEELVIVKKSTTPSNAGMNFLASAFSLQQ